MGFILYNIIVGVFYTAASRRKKLDKNPICIIKTRREKREIDSAETSFNSKEIKCL